MTTTTTKSSLLIVKKNIFIVLPRLPSANVPASLKKVYIHLFSFYKQYSKVSTTDKNLRCDGTLDDDYYKTRNRSFASLRKA